MPFLDFTHQNYRSKRNHVCCRPMFYLPTSPFSHATFLVFTLGCVSPNTVPEEIFCVNRSSVGLSIQKRGFELNNSALAILKLWDNRNRLFLFGFWKEVDARPNQFPFVFIILLLCLID